MNDDELKAEIKAIIARVTGLEVDEIEDSDSFVVDLDLDSLAVIEIGVEVSYAYELRLTEDELGTITNVNEAVTVVRQKLAERVA